LDSPHASSAPPPKGGKKYTLQNPTNGTNCGSVAEVVTDWEGNSVLEGTTCVFDYCPQKEDGSQPRCAGTGDEAECITCGEVHYQSSIKPSSSVCAALATGKKYDGSGTIESEHKCFFTHEADLSVDGYSIAAPWIEAVKGAVTTTFTPWNRDKVIKDFFGLQGELLTQFETGTCAELIIDCSKLKSCHDYDDLIVRNSYEQACLDDIDPIDLDYLGLGGDLNLKDVCKEDPCKLAPKDEICQFYEGTGGGVITQFPDSFNCVNSGYISGIGTGSLGTTPTSTLKKKDGSQDTFTETCVSVFH
jgi:hypothetical protein